MSYSSAHEIIPGLFLGDKESSSDRDFLLKHDIELIVNCTKTTPFQRYFTIEEIRVPIDDKLAIADSVILLRELPMLLMKIHMFLENGRNVLVHCVAGVQRSATVVAAYLMFYDRKVESSYKKAVIKVQNRRPVAFHPGINFRYTLAHFEEELKKLS